MRIRRGYNQSKRARKWGRDSAYLIGNGSGRNRWSQGRAKRRGKFGRNYKPSWR